MKKYLVKIRCNGKVPTTAFRTVEANNPTEAIVHVNNNHIEKGVRDRWEVIAVYEQVWNIDPDKM